MSYHLRLIGDHPVMASGHDYEPAMLLFIAASSCFDADQVAVVGSAVGVDQFEFPARTKGGGGIEKFTAACDANPWKGCDRFGDADTFASATGLFTSSKLGVGVFNDNDESEDDDVSGAAGFCFGGLPRLGRVAITASFLR